LSVIFFKTLDIGSKKQILQKDIRAWEIVASLAWHLKGLAILRYESQNIRPERVNELKDILVAKFKIEKEASLDIYTMKQSPGETLNQFLNRLEQATYINNIPENVQVQIALKGMEGMVGQAMGAHAPKTLQEVRNLQLGQSNVDQVFS
jgi:hypothetical protein